MVFFFEQQKINKIERSTSGVLQPLYNTAGKTIHPKQLCKTKLNQAC